MSEKKLTIKDKAHLYDNWLEYVAGRGWTECFAEPEKIKQEFDRLNKEIVSHKGTGIMLSKENQILKRHKTVLKDELKVLQAKYEALKKELEKKNE